jgi:hypothetical protein
MCSASIPGALTCGKCLQFNRLIGQPDLTASTTLSKNMPAGFRPPIVHVMGLPARPSGECGGGGSGRRSGGPTSYSCWRGARGTRRGVLPKRRGRRSSRAQRHTCISQLPPHRLTSRGRPTGCGPGHRHFVHNGVPNKFGVADNEIKDSDPAGAASIEGSGVSPQRFDQAGDLLSKFRYRNVIRSLDAAS